MSEYPKLQLVGLQEKLVVNNLSTLQLVVNFYSSGHHKKLAISW
jgi:hypothetical protein